MYDEKDGKEIIRTRLYFCDGKIPTCNKIICYIYGRECMHTTDVYHRLIMFADGIQIPTKFDSDSFKHLEIETVDDAKLLKMLNHE